MTLPDGAEVELSAHRRPVGLTEFLTWPKADRAMLDDIAEMRGDKTDDPAAWD